MPSVKRLARRGRDLNRATSEGENIVMVNEYWDIYIYINIYIYILENNYIL